MADNNFMRRYILTAGVAGKEGFKIGHIRNARQEALHISFSIEKSDSESANNGKVQIWNLSEENIRILEQKNCSLVLRAGYGDSLSLILTGDVSEVITTLNGADKITEVVVVDGLIATKDTQISMSISGIVDCKKLYDMIAKEMGISIVYSEGIEFKTMPNGFSYVGKCKNALQKVAKYCEHTWSIQNGVIQVLKKGGSSSSKGYVLSAETGLIGMPKRIKISKDEDETGWEITYLLNGAIGINDVVKVESKYVNGNYKITNTKFDGDNYGGEWICTAQVVAL